MHLGCPNDNPCMNKSISFAETTELEKFVQIHYRCSVRYCLRGTVCRFGYPKNLQSFSKFSLLHHTPTFLYPCFIPARNSTRLNGTNPVLFGIIKSNTDCKPILSQDHMVIM